MPISIRAARPDETERLTEIACRSKAHWGYSPEQIAAWRPAFLTVTADYITRHSPVVAVDEDYGPVAFAALERAAPGAVLEHLWVLPGFMGRGIGSRLFATQRTGSERIHLHVRSAGGWLLPQARRAHHRRGRIGAPGTDAQPVPLLRIECENGPMNGAP